LQEEEGDFGEVGGFADAVDADDGEDVGARAGGVCVLDFAEEVEGVCGSEDFGERFLHGGLYGCFDAREVGCLHPYEIALNTFA